MKHVRQDEYNWTWYPNKKSFSFWVSEEEFKQNPKGEFWLSADDLATISSEDAFYGSAKKFYKDADRQTQGEC